MSLTYEPSSEQAFRASDTVLGVSSTGLCVCLTLGASYSRVGVSNPLVDVSYTRLEVSTTLVEVSATGMGVSETQPAESRGN